MNATLECGIDALTIWFGPVTPSADALPIDDLPRCQLLIDDSREICGFRFGPGGLPLCPRGLPMIAAGPDHGSRPVVDLETRYDPCCDMGYIYLEKRGPGSSRSQIDCGIVILDVGDDGVIIGIEVFSPSQNMPRLASQDLP